MPHANPDHVPNRRRRPGTSAPISHDEQPAGDTPALAIRTPDDVTVLLEEQVNAVRNDALATATEKARCIANLSGIILRAIGHTTTSSSNQGTATTTTMTTTLEPAPAPTLGEWAERLFTTTWNAHAPGAINRRRSAYRLYVGPELATTPIALAPATIEAWLVRLTSRNVPVSQVQYSYDLLRALLGVWAKRHAITNPISFVDRPRKPACDQRRAKDRALTAKQYTMNIMVTVCVMLALAALLLLVLKM